MSSCNSLIDINEATVDVFETLAGVGRAKAEAIADARKCVGWFTSVNDLLKVAGIGRSIIEQNRAVLVCSCPSSDETSSSLSHCRETRSQTAARTKQLSTTTTSTSSSVVTDGQLSLVHVEPDQQQQQQLVAAAPTLVPSTSGLAPYWMRHSAHAIDPYATAAAVDKGNIGYSQAARTNDLVETSSVSVASSSKLVETSHKLNETKTPNDVRQVLLPLFTTGQSHSNVDANVETNGAAAVVVGADDDGDATSSAAASVDDDNCSLRSRIPVSRETMEKHWMKRKADDKKAYCFSKKPCNIEDGPEALRDDCAPTVSHSTLSSRKQRIPSRSNPPPMLSSWLHTFQEWDHAERLLALDELMELCNPTQVRHVMQVIEPQFQRDFISLLPKELALYVLSFLDPRDLSRASQTCHYWHILAEDNLLWREKCLEEGLSESLVWPNRSRRRRQMNSAGCGVNPNGAKTLWKSVYKRQRLIENNWSRATVRAPKVLKGHDDHVITCLEFCGNKIVSGSDDNTLKVWSVVSGKCLRTLVGHTGGVWSSQMSGNTIISGSTDRTLKVWNAETGQCMFTLYGHTSTVRCMHLHGNKLVSGSRDATLRVWDIESGLCLHVLTGHVAAVRCVQYDGRKVVSGAYDYMVKIWDPEHETCLQTLSGHTNRVYSLQFDGVHIVSGSLDTSIRVWNAETGACLHTLIGHQSLTSGMELKDDILVSGNADSTVKVWNITTGQCLQTLQGPNKHQSAVTCLQFTRRFVVTSSDDGTVKIWDLRTGDFLRNLVELASGGSGGVVWRIRCSNTKLVCAVGSRNGTEETKLLVLDFDVDDELMTAN